MMVPENNLNSFFSTASADFEAAMKRGFWRSLLRKLWGGENDLLPFDEIRKHLPMQGIHYAGMKEISLDQIVGSVGRYHDFDREFLPRYSHVRDRWMNIDIAHLKDIDLPPIDVYKIGEAYFVKDGNHRVSVARKRGQQYIDANVTEIDVPVPVDARTSIDDLIRKHEQIIFLADTGLLRLRPEAEVELTVPGGYGRLMEHIAVHQWYLGEARKAEVPWPEAVVCWYDEVYMPLVRVIRSQRILSNFPQRSETDLYLWIIEHLGYLKEESEEVSLEEAAAHFVEVYGEHPLHWIMNLIKESARLLTGEADGIKTEQGKEED